MNMETKKRQAKEWLDDLKKVCGEMYGEIADIDIELKKLEDRRKDLLRHIYTTEKRIERAMADVARLDEHT
jgi:regulator of replication initiation timing